MYSIKMKLVGKKNRAVGTQINQESNHTLSLAFSPR